MRRPRIYVAGPMESVGDLVENVRRAAVAASDLLEAGLDPFVPHLSAALVSVARRGPSRGRWIEWGLSWLAVSDAVLRLPGESPGSDAEVAEARRLGIPVFHSIAACRAWAWDMAGSAPRPVRTRLAVLAARLLRRRRRS